MRRYREQIALSNAPYSVELSTGRPEDHLGEIQALFSPGPTVIITDSNVGPLYAEALKQALECAGWTVTVETVPAGESSKNWAVAGELLERLITAGLERGRPLIGLGGGVVGDLTGFVSSTYLRGAPVIQIATSLLAMVDSSVGGKTGLNHGRAKNQVGTFHQPSLVICPTGCLTTLPEREIRCGLGEWVKAGLLSNPQQIEECLDHPAFPISSNLEVWVQRIHSAIQIKARIVEADERESGERALLNLGHTFGHALEASVGFGQWSHGEAVCVGMVAAAHVSVEAGLAPANLPEKVVGILERMGLPTKTPELQGWEKALYSDKKRRGETVRFVCLEDVGKPRLQEIPLEKVIFWIQQRMFG